MGATDEEKAEAIAEVDDEFAGRQQQMETAIIQVDCWVRFFFFRNVLLVHLKLATRGLTPPPPLPPLVLWCELIT